MDKTEITAYLRVLDKGTSLMVAVTKPCRKIGAKAGDTVKVTITLADNGED